MKNDRLNSASHRGFFTAIGNIISNIFSYLSCHKEEPLDNRVLLRRLYNSGYLDDQQFYDLCKKSSNNNFDPEELPM